MSGFGNVLAMIAVAVAVGVCPVAVATQYTLAPRIDQYFQFDNNLRLTTRNEIEANEYRLSPGIKLSMTGDQWRLSGDARLDTIRLDESSYNSDDQHLTLTLGHVAARRQLQLGVRVARQSQRTAEIESTGQLGFRADRTAYVNVRPASQWQLSELYSLSVGGSFTNHQYDLIDFQDYKSYGLDATLSRQLSDRMLLEFVVFSNRYDSDRTDVGCSQIGFFEFVCVDSSQRESDTVGAQIGLRRALRERYEWGLSLGGREVDSTDTRVAQLCNLFLGCGSAEQQITKDSSSGLIASMSLAYKGTKLNYDLSYQRSVSPAGIGFLLETDRFDANTRYRASELLDITTRLLVLRADSATAGQQYKRDFESIEVAVPWRLTARWRLIPGVRWRRQEAGSGAASAESTSIFLNLYFRPKRIEFSR